MSDKSLIVSFNIIVSFFFLFGYTDWKKLTSKNAVIGLHFFSSFFYCFFYWNARRDEARRTGAAVPVEECCHKRIRRPFPTCILSHRLCFVWNLGSFCFVLFCFGALVVAVCCSDPPLISAIDRWEPGLDDERERKQITKKIKHAHTQKDRSKSVFHLRNNTTH